MGKAWSVFLFLGVLAGCGSLTSSKDSANAQLQLELGTSQLESGAYPQALASLLKAESMDPDNPIIQNNLGLAYFVRERYKEAETHIRKAISLKSDYSDAHNNLGRVLIEMGRYKEAVAELQKVVSDLTYGTPEKPLINLGIVYFRVKNFETAKSY